MIYVVDTETSCLEGEEGEGCIVELASVGLDKNLQTATTCSFLFGLPEGKEITPRAQAVHHIGASDVADKSPLAQDAFNYLVTNPTYIVAHNVEFDRKMIERQVKVNASWICTLKCARVAWPDLPSYGNQPLRYLRRLSGTIPSDLYPHRALYDAIVTSWIFKDLLNHFESLDVMVNISSRPSLIPRIHFGKHKGTMWKDAPRDYLRWILSKDFDTDVMYTARYWLEGR